MLLAPPHAQEWARTTSSPVDLRLLEAHVTQEDAAVFRALGGVVATERAGWYAGPRGKVVTALSFVVLVLPVAGMAAFLTGGEAHVSAHQSITTTQWSDDAQILVATLCFWLTAVVAVVHAAGRWAASLRFWDTALLVLPVWAALFAVICLVAFTARDVSLWAPPTWGVWLTVASPLVVTALFAPLSRDPDQHDRRREIRLVGRFTPQRQQEVDDAVSHLSPGRRTSLIETRDDALDVLVRRGLVEADLVERAVAAPLGTLGCLDG